MLIVAQAHAASEQGRDSAYVGVCPDCSGKLIAEGGCERCVNAGCGWSRCG